MKKGLLLLVMMLMTTTGAMAHCQVPCGIYDDQMRINQIAEDATTIEKAMNEITRLSVEGDKNYNQLVRWVNTKEEHAQKIQDTVAAYFLAQRIKFPDDTNEEAQAKYDQSLALLHQITVYAMKAKQTTDLAQVQALRDALHVFSELYFNDEEHTH